MYTLWFNSANYIASLALTAVVVSISIGIAGFTVATVNPYLFWGVAMLMAVPLHLLLKCEFLIDPVNIPVEVWEALYKTGRM